MATVQLSTAWSLVPRRLQSRHNELHARVALSRRCPGAERPHTLALSLNDLMFLVMTCVVPLDWCPQRLATPHDTQSPLVVASLHPEDSLDDMQDVVCDLYT